MSDAAYGDEPVHEWFGLTYANYLVLNRSLLQSMPQEWQARFVAALDELREAYDHLDQPTYDVRVLARAPEFGIYTAHDDCDGEGCEECDEGVVYEDRYETAEEVGFKTDPIPHYNRGRTRVPARAAS